MTANQSTVRAGTEIRVKTERPEVAISLTEMAKDSWVVFELPGFANATSGKQQDSIDALRKATEASYFKGPEAVWVKLVIPPPPKGIGMDQFGPPIRRINDMRSAEPSPVQEAIDLLEVTSRAADLFLAQPMHEKQTFLRLILKSASWKDARLQTEFEEPFESLRRSNQLSTTQHKENGMVKPNTEIWLPGQDSNLQQLG